MGNCPVAFRSDAKRQNASAQAITAAGVSKDAIARAMCWFLRGFCRTLAPEVKRFLTTIRLESQFSNSHTKHIVTLDQPRYENAKDSSHWYWFHGKGARGERAPLGQCRNCVGRRVQGAATGRFRK